MNQEDDDCFASLCFASPRGRSVIVPVVLSNQLCSWRTRLISAILSLIIFLCAEVRVGVASPLAEVVGEGRCDGAGEKPLKDEPNPPPLCPKLLLNPPGRKERAFMHFTVGETCG